MQVIVARPAVARAMIFGVALMAVEAASGTSRPPLVQIATPLVALALAWTLFGWRGPHAASTLLARTLGAAASCWATLHVAGNDLRGAAGVLFFALLYATAIGLSALLRAE